MGVSLFAVKFLLPWSVFVGRIFSFYQVAGMASNWLLDPGFLDGSKKFSSFLDVLSDIMKLYPDKVWLGSEHLGYVQHVQMEVFPPDCELCKAIGHKRGECRSSSSVLNMVFSSNPSFPIKNGVVDADNVDDVALGDVVTPKPLDLSFMGDDHVIECISCLAATLVDSMVGVVPVALGPRLCVSAGDTVNCEVNAIPVLSCANSVTAKFTHLLRWDAFDCSSQAPIEAPLNDVDLNLQQQFDENEEDVDSYSRFEEDLGIPSDCDEQEASDFPPHEATTAASDDSHESKETKQMEE
ncbi:hypothetical protein MA16_Dca020043 [Dendrobium catenatum]|uniref:Uncharacterized protein n=1 Tax=Dendrobium catenatum TaxID=906689 RepID=A0A2I0VYM1_9ASPA|nr:hypothetical protein MA16_Dca020043 [Dendrobium catenatum]